LIGTTGIRGHGGGSEDGNNNNTPDKEEEGVAAAKRRWLEVKQQFPAGVLA